LKGERLLLGLILAAYVVLGVLYAAYTPPWQVPDEPAHYNYVRALVEEGAFPVMEPGDYDQAYLQQITDQQNPFPQELSIDPITYEDHQPPLYYVLSALVYLSSEGALLPMRLLSVAMGLGLLLVVYGLVRDLFPDRPVLALWTTAFVAFVPQHLAMLAGVENDALAELLVAASLWMAVRYVQGKTTGRQFLIGWGMTLGLILVTKVSGYVALPVALLAVVLRARRERRSLRWAAKEFGWIALVAMLLSAPWFLRNVRLYGLTDPLGTARHNSVVVGQPLSVDWVAEYGLFGLLGRMARTTFQSFWGQFGWMGVPLHASIYLGLLILSAVLAAGCVGWLIDERCREMDQTQREGVSLLAASTFLTVLLFLAYNLTFVQHQGRYLFPALMPIGLAAALGLEWLLSDRVARWAAIVLLGLACALALWGVVRGDLPLVPMAGAFGLATIFGLAALVRRRWERWLSMGALVLALVALDVYALFWAIVPTLGGMR
jgi:4-amino-4-deoxy-L-arabinose transferase-like glycosyltransferase